MKLTIFLSLLTISQLWATETYSQMTKLTIKLEDVKVSDALKEIENQSEFFFLYSPKLIDVERKVNINAEKESIKDILHNIFDDKVKYLVYDRQIILTANDTTSLPEALQQQKIVGTVTDEKGNPLPGVTVLIKGTTLGALTDASGKYVLDNPPKNPTIIFSFIGMTTQEIPSDGRSLIDVVLKESEIGLQEVVIVGYGTIKKQDITGSVTSIRGDALTQRQSLKVTEALQGMLPGVTVSRNGSAPGADASIIIRGITTIGNNDPLVIIDGIPGNINDINPNDIETISVLKDAASASIYGSRAAAGVILINTKRAKEGELNLTYNVEYGISQPTTMPKYVGAQRNMQIMNEMMWNDNNNAQGGEYPTYSQDVINNYPSLHAENPDKYPDTDWQHLLLNDYAPFQKHLLTINAGTNKISSRISLEYDNTDALYDGRNYERITVRANNNVAINKYLSATIDLYYMHSVDNRTINDLGIDAALPPIYAAVWSDGLIARGTSMGQNPYALLKYGGFNNTWDNSASGKISLDLSPLNGLKISAVFAPFLNFNKNKIFNKQIPFTDWDTPDYYSGYIIGAASTSLTESRDDGNGFTSQFLVNYMKTLGENDFNIMIGNENFYNFYEHLGASSDYFTLDSFPYLDLGNKNFITNGGNAYENAYRSFFGRILYNYKSKYLFQTNARIDGSSRFAKDYRWGLFPSFSAGWVISKESFMQNINPLLFLKIRASWGSLGNERIGNYPYQSTIAFGNSVLSQGDNVVSGQTAAIAKYAINNISWETTETSDIGIDVNAFNNKLKFTGDYYQKKTKKMLLALEIPNYIGLANPDQNTGEMHTKGWEFELGWNDKIGDLNYSASFNLSNFKSVMGNLGGTQFIGDQVKFKGSEFNEWYGYEAEGLYQTQADLKNSPVLNSTVTVGDIKYKDISGPNGVPDGIISPEYDRVLLGGSLPRYLYGGNIHLDYKNWDFSIVVQGVGKQNSVAQRLGEDLTYNFNAYFDGNYWSVYNTDAQNQKVKYPRLTWPTNMDKDYYMSDYWIINGAYFRLKNITLGYNLPNKLIEKIHIQNLRVYASASNLFCIDHYPKGIDPETSISGYWITKSYTLGISVKF